MQRHFDQDLAQLKEALLTMGSYAEKAVAQAVKALVERDDALAQRVKDEDTILDRYEVTIDEMGINLLALQGPVASDLRLITMVMKASQDLERVGDEATTMVRRVLELNREPPLKTSVDIPRMTQLVLAMLKQTFEAFVSAQAALAREVIARDREVDQLHKEYNRELVDQIRREANAVPRGLHLMVIVKCLERIADHATNIAEEVVFLLEGRDIRHTGKGAPPPPPPAS